MSPHYTGPREAGASPRIRVGARPEAPADEEHR